MGTLLPPGTTALKARPVHTATVFVAVDELFELRPSSISYTPGRSTVPSGTDQFGAGAPAHTDLGILGTTIVHDGHHRSDGLHVVHHRGAAVKAFHRWEGRLDARISPFALEALEQRGLLSTDVGTGAHLHMDLVVEAAAEDVPAQPTSGTCFRDGLFQDACDVEVLPADVDVTGVRTQREARGWFMPSMIRCGIRSMR